VVKSVIVIVLIVLFAVAMADGVSVVNADQCSAKLTAPVSQPTFTSSYVLVQIPVSVNCPAKFGQTYAGAAATDTSAGTIVLTQGSVLDSVGSGTYAGSVVLRFSSSVSQGDEIQITALIYNYDATNGLGSQLTTASETWQANFSLPVNPSQTRSSLNGCNPSTDGACCPYGVGYSNLYCPGYVNNGAGCLYPSGTPFYEMPGICPSSTPSACPYNYYYVNGYCYQYYYAQLPLCSQPTAGLIECFPAPNGQQYCFQTNVGVYSCYPYINNPPYYPYYSPQTYIYPCYLSNSIYYCY